MAKLSKRIVDAIRPDPAGRADVFAWDSELRGFGLRMKPSGGVVPHPKLTSGCPEPPSASLPSPKLLFLGSAIDRVADRTGAVWKDAATAVYHALCARELTAESAAGDEIPSSVWRSWLAADFAERISRSNDGGPWGADGRYINPSLTTQSVEFWLSQPSHEAPSCPAVRAVPLDGGPTTEPAQTVVTLALLPPYVRFLVEMSDCILGAEERKKEDIESEIRARWPDELRPASQALVGYMATMLRPPEAQRGGAKPSRPGRRNKRDRARPMASRAPVAAPPITITHRGEKVNLRTIRRLPARWGLSLARTPAPQFRIT